MTNYIEQFMDPQPSVCLLWKNMQILCLFFSWVVQVFLMLNLSFYILYINSLLDIGFAYIFCQSVGYLFVLMMGKLQGGKNFCLIQLHCLFLLLVPLFQESTPKKKKKSLRPVSVKLLPMFFSKNFMVSGVKFFPFPVY